MAKDTIDKNDIRIRFTEPVDDDAQPSSFVVEKNVQQASFDIDTDAFLLVEIGTEAWYLSKDDGLELYKWLARSLGRTP